MQCNAQYTGRLRRRGKEKMDVKMVTGDHYGDAPLLLLIPATIIRKKAKSERRIGVRCRDKY